MQDKWREAPASCSKNNRGNESYMVAPPPCGEFETSAVTSGSPNSFQFLVNWRRTESQFFNLTNLFTQSVSWAHVDTVNEQNEWTEMCPGGPAVCSWYTSNGSDGVNITRCHVSHSKNTVPSFNCSQQLSINAFSTAEVIQKEALCPVDNTAYNDTTFTVNESNLDDEPLECVVRYRSPTDPSNTYLTEHFVVPRKVGYND